MIVKHGKEWVLKSKDGKKILGTHPSYESAMNQERAILISQARKSKDKS